MAKKTKKKRTARKKAPARRANKKKSASRARAKPAAAKRSSTRSSNSVDSLLKKFDKDRSQKEAQLAVLQKKRVELEDKTRKLQEQISKVSQQIRETESQIGQLDSQRDQEVRELLAKLGVKLGGGSTAGSAMQPKPHERGKVDRGSLSVANGRND